MLASTCLYSLYAWLPFAISQRVKLERTETAVWRAGGRRVDGGGDASAPVAGQRTNQRARQRRGVSNSPPPAGYVSGAAGYSQPIAGGGNRWRDTRYVPLNTEQVISEMFPNPISWFCSCLAMLKVSSSFFLFVCQISREWLNGCAPNWQVPRSEEFESQGQRSRSPGT